MDAKIKRILNKESNRQKNVIELIASENYVSKDVLKLSGSIFTNKYAEGYSNHRYYGGCKYIDEVEDLAIYYATKLFNCKYANVQPHCGSSANMAVYRALLNKGDKIMGLNLSHGGHLTHGHKVNFSGIDYEIVSYNVNPETYLLDYDEIQKIALIEKPKLIIAGYSAYPRTIDFKKFKEIANSCGAYLMVDMAHIAGLVATGYHDNPCLYADVVTSTTHKTLRGPRGGLILTNNEEIIKKINKAIFPGIQGGPLMHIIAAKAQCFYEALQPSFKEYQNNVLKNIQALSNELIKNDINVITGGTDNHLILVDVTNMRINGSDAEKLLEEINITVNKNTIPYDTLSPNVTSGIRIGSPFMTSRGLTEKDFTSIGKIISLCLKKEKSVKELKNSVKEIIKNCKN